MSAEAIFANSVKSGNQVIEVTDGDGVQYVAESIKGASPEADAWQCYAVFPIAGALAGRHVRHASGLHAPGWSGENLPGLTYIPVQEEA